MNPENLGNPSGATPQGNQGATPNPPAGATPGGSAPPEAIDPHAHRNAVEERDRLRKKLADIEKAQADAETAKLGDLDKATKKAEAAEKENATLKDRLRSLMVKVAVQSAANKAGITDSDAAIGLLGASGITVEYDDKTGEPTNIEAALKQLIQRYPILQSKQEPPPRPNSGGPTNPSKGQAPATDAPLTKELVASMSMQDRMRRLPEIRAWLEKGQQS